MDYPKKSLELHEEWQGKIEIHSRAPVKTQDDLSLAYTPGVASPCLEIRKDPSLSFSLTSRNNMVAVVTDGTAVLGLGDIGPEAGMPVMEGKCVLFKTFGNVDAFPLCIRSKDVDEIVQTVYLLSGTFGGINLEDISAPRCFEIERKLKELCDIPVFHDDQHGTAVVLIAALINALKLVDKKITEISVVISGAGAAGIAIARHLLELGVKKLRVLDRSGILSPDTASNPAKLEIAQATNPSAEKGDLATAMKNADVFIGVSAPGLVTSEMVASMNPDPIVFAMANPIPEIFPEEARKGGAAIIGTGRSDYPNQINNVLAFPGIFRGALDVQATSINPEMIEAAIYALSGLVGDDELSPEHIIPLPFDERVVPAVSKAVALAAIRSGAARKLTLID